MKGKKTGGRLAGVPNKTSRTARELFLATMDGEQANIKQCLDKVRKKNPATYLLILAKYFAYFMPKKLEVDTPTSITVNVKRTITWGDYKVDGNRKHDKT